MTDRWQTNTSLEAIAGCLRQQRRVVVLTHSKPDGDAIGSTMAIVRAVNQIRPSKDTPAAEAWYFGPMPPFAEKVIRDTPARNFQQQSHPGGEPDAIVIVDTGSWSQLEQVREWLGPRIARAVVIDHHRHGDPDSAERRVVSPEASAACQIVADLCRLVLQRASMRELPVDVAEACYLGIATDTGWFRHSNTTADVLRVAADLLDAGVNAAELYRVVEQTDREARIRLLGRALTGMQVFDDGRFALLSLTRQDFSDVRAEQGDAGGFADYAQTIETVRVVAMFTESEPDERGRPVTKVSLRSKDTEGGVDVNQVARQFGGGGHIRAAGARIQAPIDEARRLVLEALRNAR